MRAPAHADVHDALCTLDTLERNALDLIYGYGRSQEQVAFELELPLSIVRVAVAHGMRVLAFQLTSRGPLSRELLSTQQAQIQDPETTNVEPT